MDKGMECTCPSHVRRKSSHMQPNQINVVREGFAEVVDLDHDAIHLNRVFAPDVDLLQRCLVYVTSFRALAQVGNEVGSLACLVTIMADTAPVAASITTGAENGALPQRGELTT